MISASVCQLASCLSHNTTSIMYHVPLFVSTPAAGAVAAQQEELIARCNIYGTVRTPQFLSQHVANAATNRCHPRHLGPEEPVVALAQAGDVYKLQYTVGGGGGHSINISNWTCDVFDAAVPFMESGSASWLVGYLGLLVGWLLVGC